MTPSHNTHSPLDQEALIFSNKKQALIKIYSKAIVKQERKINNLQLQLNQSLNWASVHHRGELIKANFSELKKTSTTYIVWDWETESQVELLHDAHTPLLDQMEGYFKSAKRLKRGIEPLHYQLEKAQNQLNELQNVLQRAENAKNLTELPVSLEQKAQNPNKSLAPQSPSSIYIEYLSENGTKIWVGRNAKANDQLTFRLANGRDLWLHARGYPGSHVVIRLGKQEAPDNETLNDAMQLALYYSKAKSIEESEIIYTERKFVSKAGKKKAGQVQVSKHRTCFVRFDKERFQKLKERGAKTHPLL